MEERGQTPSVGGEVALLPDAMPLPAVLERAGAADTEWLRETLGRISAGVRVTVADDGSLTLT